LFNKALNNKRFIYFYCINAIREIARKQVKKRIKNNKIYE